MVIDGININEVHYGAMKKTDAVNAMVEDGFCLGKSDKDKKAWASKVYDMINPNETQSPENE
jgi:hypothetical protein